MKPLVVMTTFGRLAETRLTLDTLQASLTSEGPIELVIVDNGSGPEMEEFLRTREWAGMHEVCLQFVDENIGCPRALNHALAMRKRGQAFVKIDNDIRFLNSGWVEGIQGMLEEHQHAAGLVSAMYEGIFRGKQAYKYSAKVNGGDLYHYNPVIGHAVWHTGAFMDKVGFFDVLADDHLYGFEDLIMSAKATKMAFDTVAWGGWNIENIQRWSALGKKPVVNKHVEKMRPFYNERISAIQQGGTLYTGRDGKPQERK